MNIIIRDVSPETSERIKAEADRLRLSQQELLTRLIDAEFGEPPMVLGYVELDRQGEFEDCPECGQVIGHGWLKFLSNGAVELVCEFCATSE